MNYALARQGYPLGVMIHSDQGSQYYAVTASFFHTLKEHVVHDSIFSTRKEENSVLFEYIEVYYNRISRHSANGWLSPEAFEQKYFKNLEGSTIYNIA